MSQIGSEWVFRKILLRILNDFARASLPYFPEIPCPSCNIRVNSDQGSQYTSEAFTDVLKEHEIRISMDGRGAWRDNVFAFEVMAERKKYEEVYLNAYESMREAKTRLGLLD